MITGNDPGDTEEIYHNKWSYDYETTHYALFAINQAVSNQKDGYRHDEARALLLIYIHKRSFGTVRFTLHSCHTAIELLRFRLWIHNIIILTASFNPVRSRFRSHVESDQICIFHRRPL